MISKNSKSAYFSDITWHDIGLENALKYFHFTECHSDCQWQSSCTCWIGWWEEGNKKIKRQWIEEKVEKL